MKKTKFDKNDQNITFKPDTCLNSGEYMQLKTTEQYLATTSVRQLPVG